MLKYRIEYKAGIGYNGSWLTRCDIYDKATGEHLSYGLGEDKTEAFYFAVDTYDRCLEADKEIHK